MAEFVHLHLHTHYSFLQGLGDPGVFVSRAKELDMPAIAITDTNNLHGAFEFYLLCKKKGVKPIIGVDIAICEQGQSYVARDAKVYSLVLLAKNLDGYKNLIQLVTQAYLHGNVGDRPRIDFPLLEKYSSDLIALSGDLTSELAQQVVSGRDSAFLLERIGYYQKLFGEGNYYLEIGEHPDRGVQGSYNQRLIELSKKSGVPLVATNDVHYARPEDSEAQDFLSCIGNGRRIDDPDRRTLADGNYSLRSSQEMYELFAYAPEACENTVKIADMINIEIPHGQPLLPTYRLNPDEDIVYQKYLQSYPDREELTPQEWLLRYTCFSGLHHRYGFTLTEEQIFDCVHKEIHDPIPALKDITPEELLTLPRNWRNTQKQAIYDTLDDTQKSLFDRLEYELAVVHMMGFDGYFVIVADFIGWAKKNSIPVGPGRGSAAGAIIAYLSGITNIDPIRYQLLFERFLNPARVTMPDIDIDFSDEGRGQVIDYVREKYGHDQVGQICTFGTLAARAAVKDVGKALGIPFADMNQFAKLIPARPGITIEQALTESHELKRATEDPLHAKLIDNAQKLEGTVRQLGVHACAVIIAPSPITDFCPLQHPPKDEHGIVTQFSAYPLDGLGLLKMDFLGLRNLTIIDRTLRIIENNHGIKINMDEIDMADPRVFEIFAKGDTTGVFQFESAGMRRYLQDLDPDSFEDIIAMVALYRPGPMAFIPVYVRRKHGKEKVSYMLPELSEILTKKYGKSVMQEETKKLGRDLAQYLDVSYGIAVYQEQLMQLAQSMAGFSLGEADLLRRGVGKKIREVVEKLKGDFITKSGEKSDYKPETSEFIYEKMVMPAADYSFNKSHAACYAMIAYQTAYLKAYYPTEFLTSLMVSDEDDTDRIVLEINEARSKGIAVLVPDVNQSRRHFTYIDKDNIRFGLKAVKGVGDGPVSTILRGREEGGPYTSLEDFITRTGSDVINKKTLEALIKSGAMDQFGERGKMLANVERMSSYLREIEHKNATNQLDMFSLGGHEEISGLTLTDGQPLSFEERIREERSVIGMSISGDPLDGLTRYIEKKSLGLEHVKKFLEELQNVKEANDPLLADEIGEVSVDGDASGVDPDVPLPPEDKKIRDKDKPVVQIVGYVDSIRKIQTKKGESMLIVQCSSTGWKFTVVVFPKFYPAIAHKIQEGEIIRVKGRLALKVDMGEISLEAEQVENQSISALRQAARLEGLFGDHEELVGYPDEHLIPLTRQYICEITDDLILIKLRADIPRETLLEIKTLLETLPPGNRKVWLEIGEKKIDTKKSLQ